jgi:predicted ArsR family transcriptional regulator
VTPDPELHVRSRALADPTRYRIYTFIAAAERPVGVAELADHAGVHPNAVRQHVGTLRDAGLVVEETAPPRGRGRPALQYRAAPGGRPAYRDLALMLVTLLRDGGVPREVGAAAGEQLVAARIGRGDDADAATVIEATARELGFAPRREDHRDGVDVVLEHCPFADTAALAPDIVCELHHGLAAGIAAAAPGGVAVTDLVVRPAHRAGCRIRLAAAPT